jgi:Fic family protein
MRTRYLDIDDRTEDLADRLRDAPSIGDEFARMYELSWLYHENALEGVVYTGQELEQALANALLTDATVIDAFQEIRNHKKAIELIRAESKNKKVRLTLTLIKKVYETLGSGIEGRSEAEYRKDMPLHRAYFHDIAQPAKIAFQLGKLIDFCDSAEFKTYHPLKQASKIHHAFMQAYPFTEGSGKVARLLANLVLLREGYLPCIVHAIDRQRYYESLRLPEPQLRELMMEAYLNALENGEKFVDMAVAERSKRAVK